MTISCSVEMVTKEGAVHYPKGTKLAWPQTAVARVRGHGLAFKGRTYGIYEWHPIRAWTIYADVLSSA